MKLAWFTPWPPQRSGIAGRSAELVATLAGRGHAVDVFVDEQDPDIAPRLRPAGAEAPLPTGVRLQSAHDFVWRAARRQYDLSIYQIGNSRLHEFIWPYLFQWPGVVVLHDARLHHARGRALLLRGRLDDYRTEFAWNHPTMATDLAELGVRGFDGPYYYEWPMTRAIVESARLVVSHSRGAADDLRRQYPGRPVEYVALGEGRSTYDLAGARRQFRAAHAIDPAALVFGVHGALGAERRVPQVLRAFAATRHRIGHARLLLAGRPDPSLPLAQEIETLGIGDEVRIVTTLNDEEFDAAIAATDATLNLRWPTALETSGPWVRSLSLSRPTVIVDLAHQGHVPVLDPRTWHRHAPCEDTSPEADQRAIAVAIDILDEDHSLRAAMLQLGTDQALRDRLGLEARRYWEQEHTVDRMVEEFEQALVRARDEPDPHLALPAHLRPDPAAFARRLTEPFGPGAWPAHDDGRQWA